MTKTSFCGARPAIGLLIGLLLTGLAAAPGLARDHRIVAPGASSAEGDWPSLAAALRSGEVQGGDRILFAPGAYGTLDIRNARFDPPLTIAAEAPGTHVTRISVRKSEGLVIRGFEVWPMAPQEREINLVETDYESPDIRFEALDIRGGPEALDYYSWSAEDWLTTWRLRGVRLRGPDNALIGSRITAISHGIIVEGLRSQVIDNEVRGFSRDGMRGLGSGSLFRGNTVRDCIKVDGNHDDGFQAWVAEPGRWGPRELNDVTLDGNRILEWTGPDAHPLRCRLQGIVMFRGPYENWTVTNNLVVISAYHGITLNAATNSRVINNTVIAADLQAGRGPWIRRRASRDGAADTAASGNVFVNNVATVLKLGDADPLARTRNTVSRHPMRDFEDPEAFDFRPRSDSRLLDAADPAYAPPHDLRGQARPQGAGPDLGALER